MCMSKKIALISDIHGNSSALKAVLKKIEEDIGIEHIYWLGDLIGIGYETNEVLELLFTRKDISFVLGNHDEAVLKIIEGIEPESKGEEREHHNWIASRLDGKFISELKNIPVKLNTKINGKKLLFLHYHITENNKLLSIDNHPSVSMLDEIYGTSETDVVCFGHHHTVHHF
jgi:predicted phosphodiesterase